MRLLPTLHRILIVICLCLYSIRSFNVYAVTSETEKIKQNILLASISAKQRLGIDVSVIFESFTSHLFASSAIDERQLRPVLQFVERISQDLSLAFPANFFESIGVTRIVIANKLFYVPSQSFSSGLMLDYGAETWVGFDAGLISSSFENTVRHIVMHEIGHAVDKAFARAGYDAWLS